VLSVPHYPPRIGRAAHDMPHHSLDFCSPHSPFLHRAEPRAPPCLKGPVGPADDWGVRASLALHSGARSECITQ
jgi:hypothetical protein